MNSPIPRIDHLPPVPIEPSDRTAERLPALGTDADLTHAAKGAVSGLWWIPADVSLTLQLRHSTLAIPRSFLYVWDGLLGESPEPSAIDQKMAVEDASYTPQSELGLGYWPRYDQLTPAQRRYYLAWHSSGRSFVPAELGYAFLYIYNLERRAIVDKKDIPQVAAEVLRLRKLYADSGQSISRSWDRYTGSFLGFLIASKPDAFGRDDADAVISLRGRPVPDDLEALLSWYAQTSTPIPAGIAFSVASCSPSAQGGVVVKRVGDQLRELFTRRYGEQHGPGIVLKASKRMRKLSYRPASAAIPPQEIAIASVFSAPKQLEVFSDLWNECVDELRKLSSVVGKQGNAKLTPQAWEAMPDELRAEIDHPCMGEVTLLFKSKTEGTVALATAADVTRAAGVASAPKMSPAIAKQVAQTLSHCGYSIEPDPRLSGKGWDDAQAVALYSWDDGAEDAARYLAASCMLDVGLALATADGSVHEEETAELRRQIGAALDLSAGEEVRLDARRHLLSATGVDIGPAVRALKKLSHEFCAAVGRMALAMIAADGVVTSEELAATRKVYRAIGLDPAAVDSEIRTLMPGHGGSASHEDEPVVVATGSETAVGEAIPAPPESAVSTGGLRLDRAAVAAIMRDTQEVAKMLAEAMAAEGTTETTSTESETTTPILLNDPVLTAAKPEISASSSGDVPMDKVPVRFRSICEALLTRDEWPMDDATKLAAQHNVMLSGALEQLNDWAVDHYGAPVFIEEDGRVLVESDHLKP